MKGSQLLARWTTVHPHLSALIVSIDLVNGSSNAIVEPVGNHSEPRPAFYHHPKVC
jgi:hypothetical protein